MMAVEKMNTSLNYKEIKFICNCKNGLLVYSGFGGFHNCFSGLHIPTSVKYYF